MSYYVGTILTVPAGAHVMRLGQRTRQQRTTTVTVLSQEPARNGKVRVFWKSQGYKASTLIG